MIVVLIFLLSTYGFMHFALCVKKHNKDVYSLIGLKVDNEKNAFRAKQCIAWISIGVSLILSINYWGLGIGIMTWFMILAVGATFIVAILSYAIKWLAFLWRYTSLYYLVTNLRL